MQHRSWTTAVAILAACLCLATGGALPAEGARGRVVDDSSNNRNQELAAAGEPLAQWGSDGSGPGQFRVPRGVAVDAEGNLFVADTGNHRVEKLSSAGEHLAQWGARGSAPG